MSLRSRIAGAIIFGGAAASAISASCTIFDGLVARPRDAGVDAKTDVGPTCPLQKVRAPKDGGGGDPVPDGGKDVSFTVVVRAIHPSPDAGFDLDNHCTCAAHPAGACRPPTDAGVVCDDDERGIDNQGAKLIAGFEEQFVSKVNEKLGKGDGNPLVRIDDYNGQPDDAHVQVSMFRSLGPMNGAGGPCGDPVVPAITSPTFAPSEAWSVEVGSAKNPLLCTADQIADGYVVDGHLVATAQTQLTLSPFITLSGKSGIVTGDIVQVDGVWQLTNVLVAGRWEANEALAAIGQQEIDGSGTPPRMLCEDQALSAIVLAPLRELVCAGRDVVAAPDKDNAGLPCDAISFALAVDTAPAQIGPTVTQSSLPTRTCPKERVTCSP